MKTTQSIASRLSDLNSTCVGTLSLATLAGATSLQAGIVTNVDLGLSGFTVYADGGSDIDWNIDNAGSSEMRFRLATSAASSYLSMEVIQNSFHVGAVGTVTAGFDLLNLGYSAQVNAGLNWQTFIPAVMDSGSIYNAVGFTGGESGYIGFQFTPDATTLYGWAEVVMEDYNITLSNASFEVVRWAYDDSGAEILTGAVPEPAGTAFGLGALALGAAGLRRTRRAKAA